MIFAIALVVRDTDGSAFITKAEFDSLKNNFQAQIDNYNSSIDSKIDGAIASYLSGIKQSSLVTIDPSTNNIKFKFLKNTTESPDVCCYAPAFGFFGLTHQCYWGSSATWWDCSFELLNYRYPYPSCFAVATRNTNTSFQGIQYKKADSGEFLTHAVRGFTNQSMKCSTFYANTISVGQNYGMSTNYPIKESWSLSETGLVTIDYTLRNTNWTAKADLPTNWADVWQEKLMTGLGQASWMIVDWADASRLTDFSDSCFAQSATNNFSSNLYYQVNEHMVPYLPNKTTWVGYQATSPTYNFYGSVSSLQIKDAAGHPIMNKYDVGGIAVYEVDLEGPYYDPATRVRLGETYSWFNYDNTKKLVKMHEGLLLLDNQIKDKGMLKLIFGPGSGRIYFKKSGFEDSSPAADTGTIKIFINNVEKNYLDIDPSNSITCVINDVNRGDKLYLKSDRETNTTVEKIELEVPN